MIVSAGCHFELDDAAGRSLGVAGHYFEFAIVVLARLGDVQVPHTVVRQLVASALIETKRQTWNEWTFFFSKLIRTLMTVWPFRIHMTRGRG